MTRTEYMEQLEKHLKKLPHKEYLEARNFFEEYFDEAGPEREADIIEELGSPKEAASELINNMLNRQLEDTAPTEDVTSPQDKRFLLTLALLSAALLISAFFLFVEPLLGIMGIFLVTISAAFYIGKNLEKLKHTRKTVWLASLALITLPITIPLLLLLIGALLGLVLLIVAFIIGAFGLGVGLMVTGGSLIWEGFTLLSKGFNVFIMGFGAGISLFGAAILLYLLTGFFTYWAWRLVKTFFQWILKRGKRA